MEINFNQIYYYLFIPGFIGGFFIIGVLLLVFQFPSPTLFVGIAFLFVSFNMLRWALEEPKKEENK